MFIQVEHLHKCVAVSDGSALALWLFTTTWTCAGRAWKEPGLFKRFEESAAHLRVAGGPDDSERRRAEAMAIAVQAGFRLRTGAPAVRQLSQQALDLLEGHPAPYERLPALNIHSILSFCRAISLLPGRLPKRLWSSAGARNIPGPWHWPTPP